MSGGFTLVDFSIPARDVPMTHPDADPPLCDECLAMDFCFFNPMCPGCQDILLEYPYPGSKTTIPELFAVMRQWVPQTQKNLSSLTREILRRGANVNDKDGLTGHSLLHYACKSGAAGVGNITSATNLVNSLILKGADTSMKCRWTDMNGLHYAVYFDAAEIVRVLLEHDPSLVMTTCAQYSNGTCLHLAAANLSLNAGKVLLQNGADGSLSDDKGRKPYQLIPEHVPNDQLEVRSELKDLLKNAAENPPPRRTKRGKSRSPAARASTSPHPAPLVISRPPADSNANNSKQTGPTVPKSPAPSNNSTISTTSTQYTGYSGSLSSRAQSPYPSSSQHQHPSTSSSTSPPSQGTAEHSRKHSEVTLSSLGLRIGDRIMIESSSSKPKRGTIRFAGTTEFHPGQWAGIELDSPIGKNDGSYGGIQYFSCKPKFGLFVPMHRISKETSREPERRKKPRTREPSSRTPVHATETQSQVMKNGIQVGERVVLSGDKVGTLRFAGTVKFAPGFWMGVELDSPSGKNDGSVNSVRYFKCRPKYGVFVLQSKVKKADSAAKKVSPNSTPVSSGAESIDYASGSISMATSGASGSSEAEASSPSPYASPGTARKRVGVASSSNRSGGRSAASGRSTGSSALSSSLTSDISTPDITLAEGMSVFVNKEMGAVKYIGTTEFADGVWLGVELRKPAGKNDGSVKGKRYFHCKANYGLFVKPEKATHRGINCAKILPRDLSKN